MNRMLYVGGAMILGLLSVAYGLHGRPAARYDVIPLQSFPGMNVYDTQGYALNDRGEAAGQALVLTRGRHEFHAVVWNARGHLRDLGTVSPSQQTSAQSLNNTGEVVGSVMADGLSPAAPFFKVKGRMRPLTALPGFAALTARGVKLDGSYGSEIINNAGQIVFHLQATSPRITPAKPLDVLGQQAVLYDRGRFRELEPLPTGVFVHAGGLNDAGVVVGGSDTELSSDGQQRDHAFLWRNGRMTDLGVPEGFDVSDARAVNARDQVVGTMSHSGDNPEEFPSFSRVQGFFWDNGRMQNLGTLPGCAYTEPTGINARGQVVGNSYNIKVEGNAVSTTGGALNGGVFLWQNGRMRDLQKLVPSGWKLQSAVAINDKGEILCTGSHDGTPTHTPDCSAFILRPR